MYKFLKGARMFQTTEKIVNTHVHTTEHKLPVLKSIVTDSVFPQKAVLARGLVLSSVCLATWL